MRDNLGLLNALIPLQKRYDAFLLWLSSKNHAVIEFMAQELGLTVSEVDVFNELGDLDEDEFNRIDKIGFDIGLLFIVVRAPKEIRNIMFDRHQEILNSLQPLTVLKSIVDEHSSYTSIEEMVRKISSDCWKSIASYLRQRDLVSGTITKKIRGMIMQVGIKVSRDEGISEGQLDWIVRAIEHDHTKTLGIFTNESIRTEYYEDYLTFQQIQEHIRRYASN